VRDEHELDGKVEKLLPKGFPELVERETGLQIAEPAGWTEAEAALVGSEQPVARDERARLREPDHRLSGSGDPDRLDGCGQIRAAADGSRPEAALHLVSATPMEPDRRVDDDGLPMPPPHVVERLPEVIRDERIDEKECIWRRVGNRPDELAPVGRAPRRCPGPPLRMRRLPAPEAGAELFETGYRSSSGGFWTSFSVA
jgi:hypothetical protein